MPQDTAIIIVAAGRGTRAGGGLPKQWRPLAGRPVLAHTLDALRKATPGRIVLVIHPDDMDRARTLDGPALTLVAGGAAAQLRSVTRWRHWPIPRPPEC